MKVSLRKPVMKYGRKLLHQVHKGIGRASLVGDAPFFSPAQFPWAQELEKNWRVIREELDQVLERSHEVWNDPDGVRVVLFLDVLRPLSFPMSVINRTVIKAIAASPLITDAKKNHEAWEQRMEELWR